jgi:hypothetical protein
MIIRFSLKDQPDQLNLPWNLERTTNHRCQRTLYSSGLRSHPHATQKTSSYAVSTGLLIVILHYLIRVTEVLSANPSVSEILWNFSRFEGRARITLEQNPHFYSSLPIDENAHTPWFNFSPIEDFGNQWRHLLTIYVLVDRPGRVFLETKDLNRSFGNVWMMNDSLIFKGLWRITIHD